MAEDSSFHWQIAEYAEWNSAMLQHFLGNVGHSSAVFRISAGTEELTAIARGTSAETEEITHSFLEAIRKCLPKGTSFCHFCMNYKGWTPDSPDPPHFFGMLWFTCLLASGFPDTSGDIRERFRAIVGTYDHFQYGKERQGCLSKLWEDLAEWTRNHVHFSELVLPPEDERLSIIGRSYYLAFPNRQDRQVLSEVLASEDLVGIEPPILPVVNALERSRHRFSKDFQDALENFIKKFVDGEKDPRDSAFWRVIRAETIFGIDLMPDQKGSMTFIASWDDDETMLVRVAVSEEMEIGGTKLERLQRPCEKYSFVLSDQAGSVDVLVQKSLSGQICLSRKLSSLINQGVLIFQEVGSGEYLLASGEEIDGASVALVRRDRVEGFTNAFGGRTEESRFDGWLEIENCKVRQLTSIQPGLEGVYQLLHTTSSPRPRLVSAIRVGNGYLWIPLLPPIIRSPGAASVAVVIANQTQQCRSSGDGDWHLPTTLQISPPEVVDFKAQFEIDLKSHRIFRSGVTQVRFVQRGFGFDYKLVGHGASYWREACNPEQMTHEGGSPIGIDIVSSNDADSGDVLTIDPSVRYLGAGLGEMSLEHQVGFEWLVTGTRKNPQDLIFVGNLDTPTVPDGGESPDAGDRRAWAKAFTSKQVRVAALKGKKYIPIEEEPRLQEIYRLYQRRARRDLQVSEARICQPSGIESLVGDKLSSVDPSKTTESVVEAVAAIGITRSGISWREFQELLCRLTGTFDLHMSQQLIRAWAEAGCIDILRRQDQSQTIIVPRKPRFVMVRRGATVDASLIGLAPSGVIAAIDSVVAHSKKIAVQPTSEFQPSVYRLLNIEPQKVIATCQAVGLDPPEWLVWPDSDKVPSYLLVSSAAKGFAHGAAPDAYKYDARWDWQSMSFRPFAGDVTDLVKVERRSHSQRCSIYVVSVGDDDECSIWCHLRSWALLRAAELRETPPFAVLKNRQLRSSGLSPIHLPLPFGRLCAVLGVALAGPELDSENKVYGYRYPFGTGVLKLVRNAIPHSWIIKGEE